MANLELEGSKCTVPLSLTIQEYLSNQKMSVIHEIKHLTLLFLLHSYELDRSTEFSVLGHDGKRDLEPKASDLSLL
jgi:hypothetical protein